MVKVTMATNSNYENIDLICYSLILNNINMKKTGIYHL